MVQLEADFVENTEDYQRIYKKLERGRRNCISLKNQWKINEMTRKVDAPPQLQFVEKPLVNQRNGTNRERDAAIKFR